MKLIIVTTLGLCLSLPVAQANEPHPMDASAKQAVKALGSTLMKEVKSAMKDGGPLNAIATCNTKAMPLTNQISNEQGIEISRTALLTRNSDNAPDAWEQRVLQQFTERQSRGEPLKGMSYSEVVDQSGKQVYRMMQAIPTQKACLACHGDNIAPEVTNKLDALYPLDKARGFAEGDLRGAFSLRKVM